jgi:hypothetical protein
MALMPGAVTELSDRSKQHELPITLILREKTVAFILKPTGRCTILPPVLPRRWILVRRHITSALLWPHGVRSSFFFFFRMVIDCEPERIGLWCRFHVPIEMLPAAREKAIAAGVPY